MAVGVSVHALYGVILNGDTPEAPKMMAAYGSAMMRLWNALQTRDSEEIIAASSEIDGYGAGVESVTRFKMMTALTQARLLGRRLELASVQDILSAHVAQFLGVDPHKGWEPDADLWYVPDEDNGYLGGNTGPDVLLYAIPLPERLDHLFEDLRRNIHAGRFMAMARRLAWAESR